MKRTIIKVIYLRVLPLILLFYVCIGVDLYTTGTLFQDISASSITNLKIGIGMLIFAILPQIYLAWKMLRE
jgi:hypothetical protein